MTTEQQVREQARELLAQECEVMGGEETARILRVGRGDFVAGCAIQALEKLMTQAAEDKRIADAVRGGERGLRLENGAGFTVYPEHDAGIGMNHRRVLIIPASVLEG